MIVIPGVGEVSTPLIGGIGVAGIPDPLVEPEALARVDVAVRVAVEERRQVVDEVR